MDHPFIVRAASHGHDDVLCRALDGTRVDGQARRGAGPTVVALTHPKEVGGAVSRVRSIVHVFDLPHDSPLNAREPSGFGFTRHTCEFSYDRNEPVRNIPSVTSVGPRPTMHHIYTNCKSNMANLHRTTGTGFLNRFMVGQQMALKSVCALPQTSSFAYLARKRMRRHTPHTQTHTCTLIAYHDADIC